MGDGYGSQIRGGKYISRDGVSYWGNSFKDGTMTYQHTHDFLNCF